jgi:hypothetical protein
MSRRGRPVPPAPGSARTGPGLMPEVSPSRSWDPDHPRRSAQGKILCAGIKESRFSICIASGSDHGIAHTVHSRLQQIAHLLYFAHCDSDFAAAASSARFLGAPTADGPSSLDTPCPTIKSRHRAVQLLSERFMIRRAIVRLASRRAGSSNRRTCTSSSLSRLRLHSPKLAHCES